MEKTKQYRHLGIGIVTPKNQKSPHSLRNAKHIAKDYREFSRLVNEREVLCNGASNLGQILEKQVIKR